MVQLCTAGLTGDGILRHFSPSDTMPENNQATIQPGSDIRCVNGPGGTPESREFLESPWHWTKGLVENMKHRGIP